ncbi:MAG: RluA family pseudouridine synthase [Clostridia bacterium]|nr:RluA family pseudouridine synthase [Clostridia bacterium]
MNVEEFKVIKNQKLSSVILSNFPNFNFNYVQKLLKQKDVKVNGKRTSKDVEVFVDDIISVYVADDKILKIETVFEDENIIIVFKRRKIETISETGELDLISVLEKQTGLKLFAVHRLDRNTEGLVIFAKNKAAKESLDNAFKNRTIDKFYLALTFGVFEKESEVLTAYLKKYPDKSIVEISDEPKVGFEQIKTAYKVVDKKEDLTLVEIELLTGKTHQIRAHLAHIGHFIIGDEKYGDSAINKKYKNKYQNLCAYRIVFHFDKNDYLSYLDGKEIILDKKKIDFCQNL